MSNRTAGQTLLFVVGIVLLIGGIACVVAGFADFVRAGESMDPNESAARPFALFGGGGLAAVIGLGVIGFTRVSVMKRNGTYTRITVEQGVRPGDRPSGPAS